ncbi:unnamed protein product [Eretmochelys imbricata]
MRDGQPSVEIEVVRDYLEKLDVHKSMGPDELHPRVLKELAAVIAEPLAIIFENSWGTGEVPDDWKKANVVPIFKKGQKEDPGNYRPVSLTSVPGKIMEQVLKESILKHLHERKEQIQTQLNTLKQERGELLEWKQDAETQSQEYLGKIEAERQKIMSEFEQLRQFLDEQERLLLAQLEELDKEIVKIQDENVTKLSEKISRLGDLISEIEEKCQQPTSEFLQDIKSTWSRCEKVKFEKPMAVSQDVSERVGVSSQRNVCLQEALKKFRELQHGSMPCCDSRVSPRILDRVEEVIAFIGPTPVGDRDKLLSYTDLKKSSEDPALSTELSDLQGRERGFELLPAEGPPSGPAHALLRWLQGRPAYPVSLWSTDEFLLTAAWRSCVLHWQLLQEVLEVCAEQQKHLERGT